MFKFKVEILIDEEKVIADDRYEPEVLYKYIRDMYKQFHLKEIETKEPNHIIFVDRGNSKDLGGIGSATIDLYDSDWCRKYATRFDWYELGNDGTPIKLDVFKSVDEYRRKATRL